MQSLETKSSRPRPKSFETETRPSRPRPRLKKTGLETRLNTPSLVCCSLHTSHLWLVALSTQHQLKGCNNVPSFLQWTALIAQSFCKGCTWHHLDILVKAPLCCDWKAQVAMAASNNRDPTSCSFYLCLFATHISGCCSSRTSRLWRSTHSTQH